MRVGRSQKGTLFPGLVGLVVGRIPVNWILEELSISPPILFFFFPGTGFDSSLCETSWSVSPWRSHQMRKKVFTLAELAQSGNLA